MSDFFQYLYDFFTTDIYIFFAEAIQSFIVSFTVSFIEFKIWALAFAWDVGKDVITTFNISGKMQSALNSQPSDIKSLLLFFRIPEVLTNLLAGLAGRWALKFIPGV